MILTAFVYSFGQEHFVKSKQKLNGITKKAKEIFSHSIKSVHYSVRHPVISLLLAAGMLYWFILIFAGEIVWYPFLQNLGFKEYWFGYLVSASSVLGIFIPYFTKTLSIKFGGYKNILFSFWRCSLCCFFQCFLLNGCF